MGMNLIQVQERLKSLPNDPRVMQMLASYANGMNPEVPPYLALGELNRRKQIMQEQQAAQASQPPQGTVKDQIEQQAGIMALQQGRQAQAQQQMMAQAGQGQTAAPEGTPQPQAQAQPGQLPAGLAALLGKRMRSGGIVAFQSAGSVADAQDEENDDDEEDKPISLGTDSAGTKAVLAQMLAQAKKLTSAKPPGSDLETRDEAIKKKIAEDPEKYGILKQPIGESYMKDFEALQEAQRAEFAKQREEAQKAKPTLIQQLGMAASRTQGQKGIGAILANYLNDSNALDQKELEREQALRAKELGLQQARMEALGKLEEARRAHAAGDFDKEQKSKVDIARIAKDWGVSINRLIGAQTTAIAGLAGRESAAETSAKAKLKAAQIAASKMPKTTDLGTLTQLHLDALVEGGADPKDSNTKLLAAQNAARDLSKSAGSVRAETDAVDKANAEFMARTLSDRELRKLRREDPTAYSARIETLRNEIKNEYGVRPNASAPKAGAAAPTNPAPGGKVMTMADVKATAAANNKTEAEVIAAAKAKGYTIQ